MTQILFFSKGIAAYAADFAGGKYTYRNKKARNGKRGFPFFVLYIGMPGAVFCICVNKQIQKNFIVHCYNLANSHKVLLTVKIEISKI